MVWRIEELELYCEQLEVQMDQGKLSYEQAWGKVRSAIHTKYRADVLGTFPSSSKAKSGV